MQFGNLLKKELRELITKQAIISMVFTMVLLIVMGQIMGTAMEEGFDTSTITLCNQDDSEFTSDLLEKINASESVKIKYVELQSDDYAAELERLDIKNVVIIPQGYGESIIEKHEPASVKFVSTMQAAGLASSMSTLSASDVISSIQSTCTNEILLKSHGLTDEQIEMVRHPMQTIEYTVNNGRTAEISASALTAITMMQSMIAPFAIFFLLLMASQMIMTAISTEKIDKTLETLLSAPVSRMTVLSAKMVAAVITALLNALFMIVGFIFYMTGMMGSAVNEISTGMNISGAEMAEAMGSVTNLGQAMTDLGLSLTPVSYVLFAVQLFFTVAIGLAISLILGAMATDVKSVQTLIMPVMIAVMIPFFITMFMDVNSMSMPFKIIVYAIPFTHTYTALTNLMNGDMIIYWAGLAYQIVFFAVCMFLAVKMFTTDKLFTMSFSGDGGKKKSGKKLSAEN
ncbi:MAG: ABC transporter permease [Oscillospiraceae bacterium]|nr:ABC transporter permease [Oscillospiraceae bacterium]